MSQFDPTLSPQPTQSIYIYRGFDQTYLRFVGDMADEARTSATLYIDNEGNATFDPSDANELNYFRNFTADPHVLKSIWTDIQGVSKSAVTVNQDDLPNDPHVQLLASRVLGAVQSLLDVRPESIVAQTSLFEVKGSGLTSAVFKLNGVSIVTTGAASGQVLTYDSVLEAFVARNPAGSTVVTLSYASMLSYIANSTLVPGTYYEITGRPNQGAGTRGSVFAQAVSKNLLSTSAYLYTTVPLYRQNSLPTVYGFPSNPTNGTRLANNGRAHMYSFGSFRVNTADETAQLDRIQYNVAADDIYRREDILYNVVNSRNAIDQFKWGDTFVTGNTVETGSIMTNLNSDYVCRNNQVYNSSQVAALVITGTPSLNNNTFNKTSLSGNLVGTVEYNAFKSSTIVDINDYRNNTVELVDIRGIYVPATLSSYSWGGAFTGVPITYPYKSANNSTMPSVLATEKLRITNRFSELAISLPPTANGTVVLPFGAGVAYLCNNPYTGTGLTSVKFIDFKANGANVHETTVRLYADQSGTFVVKHANTVAEGNIKLEGGIELNLQGAKGDWVELRFDQTTGYWMQYNGGTYGKDATVIGNTGGGDAVTDFVILPNSKTIQIETDLNTFPLDLTSLLGNDDYQVVPTIAERNAIPTASRTNMMLVGVEADGSIYKMKTGTSSASLADNANWVLLPQDSQVQNSLSPASTTKAPSVDAVNTALGGKADLVGGVVPTNQLPSFPTEVSLVANLAALPASGAVGVIYITANTNKQYRWTGTAYAVLSDSAVQAVYEFATLSAFPAAGVASTIYIDKSTNATYRWSGTAYVLLSKPVNVVQTLTLYSSTNVPSAVAVIDGLEAKADLDQNYLVPAYELPIATTAQVQAGTSSTTLLTPANFKQSGYGSGDRYMGEWNPNTNVPTLPTNPSISEVGKYYSISVGNFRMNTVTRLACNNSTRLDLVSIGNIRNGMSVMIGNNIVTTVTSLVATMSPRVTEGITEGYVTVTPAVTIAANTPLTFAYTFAGMSDLPGGGELHCLPKSNGFTYEWRLVRTTSAQPDVFRGLWYPISNVPYLFSNGLPTPDYVGSYWEIAEDFLPVTKTLTRAQPAGAGSPRYINVSDLVGIDQPMFIYPPNGTAPRNYVSVTSSFNGIYSVSIGDAWLGTTDLPIGAPITFTQGWFKEFTSLYKGHLLYAGASGWELRVPNRLSQLQTGPSVKFNQHAEYAEVPSGTFSVDTTTKVLGSVVSVYLASGATIPALSSEFVLPPSGGAYVAGKPHMVTFKVAGNGKIIYTITPLA